MKKNFLETKDVCIVAYGETKIDRATGRTAYELAAEVVKLTAALEGAGGTPEGGSGSSRSGRPRAAHPT